VTGLWLYQTVTPSAPFLLNAVLAVVALLLALLHPRVRAAAAPLQRDEDEGPVV